MCYSATDHVCCASDKSPRPPVGSCLVSVVSYSSEFMSMAKTKIALNPKHPERICWGCDKLCPANDLRCGNGTIRTQHPVELFGDNWMEWELDDQGSEPEQRT